MRRDRPDRVVALEKQTSDALAVRFRLVFVCFLDPGLESLSATLPILRAGRCTHACRSVSGKRGALPKERARAALAAALGMRHVGAPGRRQQSSSTLHVTSEETQPWQKQVQLPRL
jgi:hypothetical protein